ncbi:LPS translocon maturation chaperone LptM [Bradyrhizobium sp. 2TAF24]|uniref:LPS translocon maturation chaperone LptM n=1 Tax=Bradyrhizobium sp. 2TAF24 TaxID=3233011 RepID=UPI003F904D19
MKRTSDFSSSKVALVLLAVAALTLGACGRKSGLDLPPSASSAPVASSNAPESHANSAGDSLFGSPAADRLGNVPKGQKKTTILDPILD